MNDYLAKPFKENDLLDKIAHWARNLQQQYGGKQASTNLPRIDLSFLQQQTRNNKTFIREMISIFLNQNPREITKLQNAINKADYKTIYKTAHSLRNTIGFFGLTPAIGAELLAIEKQAMAGEDTSGLQELFDKIHAICKQAVTDLKGLSHKTVPPSAALHGNRSPASSG